MDFSLTQEQQALQDSVRRFCEREYGFEQRRQLLGRPEGFARAHWATFAELGWLGAGLAEEAGGYGGGPVETMIILEQMGRALVLEPFLSCAVLAAQAIAALAPPGQREALLEPIIAGERLVALAHDGPAETTAERRGTGYRLNGRKNFVLGGPSADLLLVSARAETPRPSGYDTHTSRAIPLEAPPPLRGRSTTHSVGGWGVLPPQGESNRTGRRRNHHPPPDGQSAVDLPLKGGGDLKALEMCEASSPSGERDGISAGISLFTVDPAGPGVTRHDYHAVDGRRVSDILLDDVELGPDALIGEEGTALAAIELAIDHGVIGLCAEAVGAMDAALWLTRDYLKTRRQFGQTINNFQALQHRMADMLIETELARSMLYRGVAALAETDPATRRKGVSAAKAQIGEAGYFVGGQAVQLHGAIGVTEEYSVGHYFKRLTLVRGLFGTTDSHLARFAAVP